MRHKKKKETVDSIAQKMSSDATGKFLEDLLAIAGVACNEKVFQATSNSCDVEFREILNKIDWLYGYAENEIQEVLRALKSKLEQKIFDKESSHVKVLTSIICFSVLSSIDIISENCEYEETINWEDTLAQSESKKISMCFDVFKRHCSSQIDVNGFLEARRYIRMWDSEYNW